MITTWLLLTLSATAGPDEGRAIYVAKCQACHGAEGRGDGPAARALPKKPMDLSADSTWETVSDKTMRTTITEGKPGSIMRGFPMPDGQLDNLMAYLESLRAED